ncbi:hypothetical protein BJX99DRAFT_254448 [Aspergillus californicus]
MAIMMHSEITIAPGQLSRGEITVIARVMFGRLRTRKTRPHTIIPFLDPNYVRLIEAHFNGHQLVVRTTPLYDIAESDDMYLDLYNGGGALRLGNLPLLLGNDPA